MSTVTVYRCPGCDERVRTEDAVRTYECSRCGQQGSEDDFENRRCPDCNIFVGKLADKGCPGCYEDLDGTEEEAWEGADGELYDSEEAEVAWIAGAAEREEKCRQAETDNQRILAEIHARNRARNEAILPQLRRLYELLAHGGHAADLRNTVVFAIQEYERDPDLGGEYTPVVHADVMARLLAPELGREADLCRNVDASYEERQEAVRAIAAAVIPRLASSGSKLAERLEGWVRHGGSPCVELSILAPALVDALEERLTAPLEEQS